MKRDAWDTLVCYETAPQCGLAQSSFHVSRITFHSLFRLNPNQPRDPKRECQAGNEQRTADDRFPCAQLFRTHKRRLPVFDSGYVHCRPVRCQEPDYETDAKTDDSRQ